MDRTRRKGHTDAWFEGFLVGGFFVSVMWSLGIFLFWVVNHIVGV